MKNRCISKLLVILAGILGFAVLFSLPAAGDDDLRAQPSCPYCGMDRTKFAHSRAYILYDDHTAVGTCSLHCAAIDLALKIDKNPISISVADYTTRKLIDAEKASWVIGGDKMGVMTRRAKWAFASPSDARDFAAAFGGEAADYSRSLKAAFEDMYDDLTMIRNKRQMMKKRKGS